MTNPVPHRQRRYRARRRRGVVVAHAELPVQLVNALVNDGDLTETDTTDPWALGAALVGAVRKLRERYASRPDARRLPQPRRRAPAPTS